MKYFVRDWCSDVAKSEKIMKEYNTYYKAIEQQIPLNIRNILHNKHDTYILKAYLYEKDYIIELEEKVWGKAYIVFKNAVVKPNNNIKEEYWLYDEIYKIEAKYEIHILLNKSEIIILCDDVYIKIDNKNYFKDLYVKEDYNIDLSDNNKKNIANTVINKEFVCGYSMLNKWEKIIYSFLQIYSHINYYKYNDIEEELKREYSNLSVEDKENKYKELLSELEEKLIKSIKILDELNQEIKVRELDEIINHFLKVYNTKDISLINKNQLYLNLGEKLSLDINNIYIKIIEYIDNNIAANLKE